MRCRLVIWVVLVSSIVVVQGRVFAQTASDQPPSQPPSLLDRLDNLGRRLFGDGRASDRERSVRSQVSRPVDDSSPSPISERRYISKESSAAGAQGVRKDPRPTVDSSAFGGEARRFPAPPSEDHAIATDEKSPITELPSVPGVMPLHERLSEMRKSPFGNGPAPGEAAKDGGSGKSDHDSIASPADSPAAKPAAERSEPLTVARPAAADGDRSAPLPASVQPEAATPSAQSFGNTPREADVPVTIPSVSSGPSSSPGTPDWQAPAAAAGAASPAGPAAFSTQSPALSVETAGPRRISVGKEGLYEVIVRNRGGMAAEQVVVSVDLPEWAEVTGAEVTAGTAPGKATDRAGPMRWQIARLEAQAQEKLSLKIVPRQSRAFELLAKCDYVPPASHATIEVQEARLVMALQGPREVLFGKGEVFRLEISNNGTADAENVAVTITSGGAGEKLAPVTHRFGALAVGQKKSISMELTARQDGNLLFQVEARGNDSVRGQLAQEIIVRRAIVKVDVEAPKVIYAGNEVTYRIRLKNQGSAAADNVKVRAAIPRGMKYVGSPQNGRLSPDKSSVVWVLDRLNSASEATIPLTCEASASGSTQLDVQCVADGDLVVSGSAVTQVETTANLALTVDDPSGPIGLDGEATYQLRLQNRGTASAQDVEVVAYFANHVEPVSADGGRHRINSGQVVFESLPSLAPGQTATFQVKVKADVAGNHIYRVEVRAKSTGDRLVREGTTRFYAADGAGETPSLARSTRSSSAAEDQRTADRRDAGQPQGDQRTPGGFKR
jgi:uncharacterized repeat protein (TIGR01451 family)